MSHSTYSLKKLSQEEQQARYDVILMFVQFNPFFAYLPYINNPTNNYQKYSNDNLNTILSTLQYGNIEDDNDPMKKVYLDFVKDYQYNSEIYIREEQEKMLRYQQEQQLLAQQFSKQYNAGTQPISFNANSKPGQYYGQQQKPQQYGRQQQQYGHDNQGYNNRNNYREGGNRDGRKQYNRDQYNNQPREHHLWHMFHTKAGDVIGVESKAEYDEFAHFKEKYGLDIKIKFDPFARFESETKLLEEDEPASDPKAEPIVKIIPKDVSEPVIIMSEPKQSKKPKEPIIKEIKKPINSVSEIKLEKQVIFDIAECQQEVVKRRHDRIAEEQFAMLFGMKSQKKPLNGNNNNEHHLWHKFHTKVGDVIEFDSRATYDEFAQFKEKYGLDVKIRFDPANKLLGEDEHIDEPEVSEQQPKKKSKKSKRKGKGKANQALEAL